MGTIDSIVLELKKERDRVQKQLFGVSAALSAFAGVYSGTIKQARKRGKMSAKGRAKVATAQRARWAKFRAKKNA